MEGRTVDEIYVYQNISGGKKHVMEKSHKILRLVGWYPKGPGREHDLIRFIADQGGMRCVRASTLTVVR